MVESIRSYGPEKGLELYYRADFGVLSMSPDLQIVASPGYDAERGPAAVAGLRVSLRW